MSDPYSMSAHVNISSNKSRRVREQESSSETFAGVLWRQRFVLEDLTLRGLEPAEETPLAHISRIEVGVNLRTLLQKRIDLFELTILQPEVHLLVSQDGKTNFPSPQTSGQRPLDFKISIQNFNVIDGSALINEQRLNMDFSVQNLDAMLDYQSQREVLKIHLGYDGVFDREPDTKLSIPYTLTADVDYTRATIIAQQLFIKSGGNQVKLQGRINQVLGKNISGKLAYTTSAEVRFLNYFFPDEKLGGKADAAGFLEFADGYFSTQGNLASDAIDFDDWHTMKVTGEYTYKFPERLLTFSKFKGSVLGGSASGEIDVDHLPGPSRITLNLNYSDINALDLARVYPWDPKYRIVSTVSGKIGRMVRRKVRALRCKRARRSEKPYSFHDERRRAVTAGWLAGLSITPSRGAG